MYSLQIQDWYQYLKICVLSLFIIVQVLVQGDILINTSLTEAFCIAIVEAACCGSVCQNPNTAIIDDQSQIIKVGSVNAAQCIFDIYNVSEYDSL